MRPKSIATVVPALRGVALSVTAFSVDRTAISLMVLMSVVWPAANGPVTTIFTARPRSRRRIGRVMSQGPYAVDEPREQRAVDLRRGGRDGLLGVDRVRNRRERRG